MGDSRAASRDARTASTICGCAPMVASSSTCTWSSRPRTATGSRCLAMARRRRDLASRCSTSSQTSASPLRPRTMPGSMSDRSGVWGPRAWRPGRCSPKASCSESGIAQEITPMMKTPPIVSPEAWEAARLELLVKEKAFTRARDRLAAERRRMPWMPVEKSYQFEGPKGKVSLLDLFEDRRQLIVYRAFFEPGVGGWPDHACRGCSFGADQVSHLAHLNARDTTLAWTSRAPQADIVRLKAKMGWDMPWYTITDSFDVDFGVDQWHGHNVFFRDGDKIFRTYFI